MVDAAHLEYEDNVDDDGGARRGRAPRVGLWVEAELGEIGGKDGAHAPGVRTDPDEAARSWPRPASTASPSRSAARTR